MKLTMTAIAAALVGAAIAAAPAQAQLYRTQERETKESKQQQQQQELQQQQAARGGATITIGDRTLTITPAALTQIRDLQAAVNAKDVATIPAKLAAAKAAATTPDERYVVAKLQLQVAVASNNDAALAAAIDEVLASGLAPREEALVLNRNLASIHLKAGRHQQAAAALQRVLELEPGDTQALTALSSAYSEQGRHADAMALIQKAMAASGAGGAAPPENLYKRALQIAYKAKLPQAVQISRDWVRHYPSATNFSDALAIYQNLSQLDETQTLDLLRLERTAGTLSAGNYFTYADIAVRKGLPGEAKAVLEEGFAANVINRSDSSYGQLYSIASQRVQGDRESLPAAPAADADARRTMVVGDAYYGYGDFAKAAEFYRAALGKSGADTNLINLRLGMALARQGDKAGAQAAFGAAGGSQAQLAEYWRLYLSTRA